MKSGRVTTREFYDELQRLNDKRSSDMVLLRNELQSIGSQVSNLVDWAYGTNGERGMNQRLRSLEDLHAVERGAGQQQSRTWRVLQQVVAFVVGVLGAIIGALI